MQTINIKQKYNKFIKKYQKTPTVAKAVIEWKDDKQQHEYLLSIDNIWVDELAFPYRNTEIGVLSEEDIFYHAGDISGLCDLADSNGEDFKILDII